MNPETTSQDSTHLGRVLGADRLFLELEVDSACVTWLCAALAVVAEVFMCVGFCGGTREVHSLTGCIEV